MTIYKVSYYYWSINRYGDKDYEYVSQWVSEQTVQVLKSDTHVDDLEVHEQKEVSNVD